MDDELELEVKDECQKYGEVVEVKVREVANRSVPPEEAVRIFVLFRDFHPESTLADKCMEQQHEGYSPMDESN